MDRIETIESRFARAIERLELDAPGGRVLAAVSGGLDSVVLLHLLVDAAAAGGFEVAAAHVDHAMREESDADAAWVRELCGHLGIRLFERRLETPPRSEAAARDARYEFLHRAAEEAGAHSIVTGHTADDQAETVLFRLARGTGLAGLRGMRPRTRSDIARPLLEYWRDELERYASERGLTWRTDPTNLDPRYARNRIRHRVIPELERVAPGAKRNIVGVAKLAAEAERSLQLAASTAWRRVAREEDGEVVLARHLLREYDPAVASRLVRRALRRAGSAPGRAGTRAAVQFITDAGSGREMAVPGGAKIVIEFHSARIVPPAEDSDAGYAPDREAVLERVPDEARLSIGGERYIARIDEAPGDGRWVVPIDEDDARFPLRLRARRAGDRVRTTAGTKSLKKLFIERRVPKSRRNTLPVLEDRDGRILWTAVMTDPAAGTGGTRTLYLTISNE